MDWWGEWRQLANWWYEVSTGWNWSNIWAALSVVVNLALGGVAYFAFKASRDSARFAEFQAQAALDQTRIAQQMAEANQQIAEQSLQPALYLSLQSYGVSPYWLRIVNCSTFPVAFMDVRLNNESLFESLVRRHTIDQIEGKSIAEVLNPQESVYLIWESYSKWQYLLNSTTPLDGIISFGLPFAYMSPLGKQYILQFEVLAIADMQTLRLGNQQIRAFQQASALAPILQGK